MHTPRIGRVFGRLTVTAVNERSSIGDGNHSYVCTCACGGRKVTKWKNLSEGRTKSCGCLYAETHTKKPKQVNAPVARRVATTSHPLYNTWRGMVRRCYDPSHKSFRYYGGRGITVCRQWLENFHAFAEAMGERPAGTSIDRVDPDTGYEPGNCRWADTAAQAKNIRGISCVYEATISGVTKTVVAWAAEKGLDPDKVKRDIRKGVPPDVAVVAAHFRKKLWASGHKVTREAYAACTDRAKEWLSARENS